jgi:glycolate oxidase iron-sulfur subunit
MVKDYGYQLAGDPKYAEKAKRVSDLARDIGEVILVEKRKLQSLLPPPSSLGRRRIAFHAPCTLQHGMKMKGEIEALLASLGFELAPVRDAHLCCGSAGTYSLLQSGLSQQLLENKVAALSEHDPEEIVTANIGCQTHIQSATPKRVRHWIELVDDTLGGLRPPHDNPPTP